MTEETEIDTNENKGLISLINSVEFRKGLNDLTDNPLTFGIKSELCFNGYHLVNPSQDYN